MAGLQTRQRPTQRAALARRCCRRAATLSISSAFGRRFDRRNRRRSRSRRAAFVKIDRHDRRRIDFGGIAPPFRNIGQAGIVFAKRSRREVFLRCDRGLKGSGGCARELVGATGEIVPRSHPPHCQRRARGPRPPKELVGMARFRVPNRPAPRAADLPSGRGQAGQLHIVGSSAGRADNQHRQISGASRSWRTLTADPLTNWKPCQAPIGAVV